MSVLDILILVVLGAFLIKGLLRGFFKELFSLVGLVAGTVLAFRFHAPLAGALTEGTGLPSTVSVAAAFILLFLCTVLFFSVLGYILSKFVNLLFLGGLNRVAGGFFGLAEGALLLSLLLFAASLGSLPESLQSAFNASQLAPPLVDLGDLAFQQSRRFFAGWR